MFDQLSYELNRNLLAGEGDVFYQFIPGARDEKEMILWLRLGRDEEFVMNLDAPSGMAGESGYYRVVERLR